MTTITVTRKGQDVAIAADAQSTFGDTRLGADYDPHYNKIFQLDDNYFGIAGSAAHDLVLQAALARLKSRDFSSRQAIFETFRKLHPKLKEDFYLKPDEDEEDPYESSQMIVLIANPHGIFSVYSLREVYEYSRFWAIGSGRDFAIGAMYSAYNSQVSATDLAQQGVEAGCEFDVGSSLPLTCYHSQLV